MHSNKASLGFEGQLLAENYLKNKGHHILYKNFKTKYGEIDLVTKKDNHLHLVEVKTTSNSNIEPYSKWKIRQKLRLVKVFRYFLEHEITSIHTEIKIIFIWFALNRENRLKLVMFNQNIEIDYG